SWSISSRAKRRPLTNRRPRRALTSRRAERQPAHGDDQAAQTLWPGGRGAWRLYGWRAAGAAPAAPARHRRPGDGRHARLTNCPIAHIISSRPLCKEVLMADVLVLATENGVRVYAPNGGG